MLNENEARLIANSSAELIAEYGGTIDPRAMLWTNLLVTLAGVYGPKVLNYVAGREMRAREAEKARNNGQQQTTARA